MIISDEQYRDLVAIRWTNPFEVLRRARLRDPGIPLLDRRRMLIIAADHPARGALQVGEDPLAMADRRDLLQRVTRALAVPGVSGFLGTPDLVEDLILLGALEKKVVIGSMNRSGLANTTWEIDDRFTAYDPATIEAMGLAGGKMLLRLAPDDPGTNATLAACARAVGDLAELGLMAMVEPLPVRRVAGGGWAVSESVAELITAVTVASAIGPTSAYTWLKMPPTRHIERLVAATTLPVLLLGGDPAGRWDEVQEAWGHAMQIPQVRGLVAGRGLLYPADGDVESAVGAAARIVQDGG